METLSEQLIRQLGINKEIISSVKDVSYWVSRTRIELDEKFPWYSKLTPVRRDVIANVCYSVGAFGMSDLVGLIDAVTAGDYINASNEILNIKLECISEVRGIELASQMLNDARR